VGVRQSKRRIPIVDHGTAPSQHVIRFPRESGRDLRQNEAFFYLIENGEDKRIKFHDYSAIYDRAGLYEQLFYERLRCTSPRVVVSRLAGAVRHASESVETLRVLDLGAGNGIVSDELKEFGVARLVGLDIIESARAAALRDRPAGYDEYFIADMTDPDHETCQALHEWRLDALTCVAALGFDDIPAAAFATAMEAIADDGWLAFNIKTDFLQKADEGGFAALVKVLLDHDLVELHLLERYRHRLSIDGEWLEYFVLVAKKRGPLPADVVERFTA
jgi:SAM-dependent methyltransferase